MSLEDEGFYDHTPPGGWCPDCQGTGSSIGISGQGEPCPTCQGTGLRDHMNRCKECHQDYDPHDGHSGYGLCAECLHDALRSGWTPSEETDPMPSDLPDRVITQLHQENT